MVAGSSGASHRTTALVTGGASGIGLATAHALGRMGTIVYVGGRNQEQGLLAVETLQ